MSKPQPDGIPFAKIVTICATSFGVGLGLCGVDYLLAAGGIGKSAEEFGVGPLDALSLVVMILSLIGLMISSIAWAVVGILRSFGLVGGGNEQQRLFDDPEEKERDEGRDT